MALGLDDTRSPQYPPVSGNHFRSPLDPQSTLRSNVLAVKFTLALRNRAQSRQQVDASSHNSEPPEESPGWIDPVSDVKAFYSSIIISSKFNILLAVIPLAIVSGMMGWSPTVIFATNFVALLPLALVLGQLTEDLILRFGESIGGLLNATFGNVVEMILGLAALSQGLMDVVAASLIGSVLSNLLLVLGCCFFFGGVKHKNQEFNAAGNKAANSLLFLACIGILTPTMATSIYGREVMTEHTLQFLSRSIAILLIVMCVFR